MALTGTLVETPVRRIRTSCDPVGPHRWPRADAILLVLPHPPGLKCRAGHAQAAAHLAAADVELMGRSVIITEKDMIIPRRLDVARLEEEVGRARAPGPLELGLPGERLGIVLPLVAPLPRRHVHKRDLPLGIEPAEDEMHVLDLAGLGPIIRPHVVVPVLPDPLHGGLRAGLTNLGRSRCSDAVDAITKAAVIIPGARRIVTSVSDDFLL